MIQSLALIYIALILIIGFVRPGRRQAEEYFVLGRALTLPSFVASLVSTWYGGILGIGEYTYRFGISNWLVFGVPYYIAALIFALFLAGRARKTRYYTIPDILDKHFGRKVSLVGALIIFFMTVPGAYVLMLGVLVHMIFRVPLEAGIVAGTLFSIVYVYRGGLRSVVRTDLFQFALMFLSFMAAVVYLWLRFGPVTVLPARLPEAHLTWTGGNSPQYVLVWYIIAMATLVEPAFYQRCFAAKEESTARRGILISILFWVVFDCMTTVTGLYARAFIPDLSEPTFAFPALAREIFPTALAAFFFLGLLATVMSTIDSYSFLSAITLGRDIVWRIRPKDENESHRFSAWALVVTGAMAVVFAVALRSVVDIWHHFGSVGTPALLFPLASTFSRRWRLRPGEALAVMLSGGTLSLGWLLVPYVSSGSSGYPLGVEPIIPGMIVSGALFFLFTRAGRRWKRAIHA